MTKKKKIILVVAIVVVIVTLVVIGIINFQKSQKEALAGAPKEAMTVTSEAAKINKIITKTNAKGNVELIDSNFVYPDTQARVKKVHVRVGDFVEAGTVLVTYDDDSLKATKDQLEDAKLDLKAAQLNLQSAKLPPSKTELLSTETQILQAEKSVSDVNKQIEQIDLEIEQIKNKIANKQNDYNKVKSLFENGVVAKKDVDTEQEDLNDLNDQLNTALIRREAAVVSLASANTALENAESQYSIIENKNEDVSSQNKVDLQQVQVEQAKLKIEQLQKSLENFKMETVSEYAGTVTELNISEGDTSVFGKHLMKIDDLSIENMVIKVNVAENKTAGIQVGQDVEITGDALGKKSYPGKVSKISPVAESKQIGNSMETVVVVDVSPTDKNAPIKPGFSLATDIIIDVNENAVVVPLMSVQTDEEGNDYVYLMAPEYKVEKRVVELGTYAGMYVSVMGINEGEKVIVSPPPMLNEKSLVKEIQPVEGTDEQNSK